MLTKQANDSWRACFATRTTPRSAGIKGERVQTHISFSLRSQAFQCESLSVYRQLLQCWCYGASAEVAIQCCCFSDGVLQALQLRSRRDLPCALQHFSKRAFLLKEQILKELHERRRLFKDGFPLVCFWMWSFLASSDGHDRCISCLAFSTLKQRSWMTHVLCVGT